MGYLAYYLLLFGASWALRYPYLLVAVVVVWLSRRWLPDPYLYLKHAGHGGCSRPRSRTMPRT